MVDFELFQSRINDPTLDAQEKEVIFREFAEANLAWRISRAGSIVQRLEPKILSIAYERKELILEYPILEWELNPFGTLHGGIQATMFDNQGGLLTQTFTACGLTPTSYLNVGYTSPIKQGDYMRIRSWITHQGKRVVNVSAEAYAASDGRVISTAMLGYMLIDRKDKK